MRRFVLPLLLVLTLAGCVDKPTTYLTLNGVAAGTPLSKLTGTPLVVSHIGIPPNIDRTQLTTESGPGILHVAGKIRWAGPLDGMAQIVLARDLAARLPCVTVLMPGDPVPPGGVQQVHVNIQNFMPDTSGNVSLQADWSIMAPDGQTILRRGRFHIALPAGPQPGEEAQIMSAAIGRLADQIAHDL